MTGLWWVVASVCCAFFLFGACMAAVACRREAGAPSWKWLVLILAGAVLVRAGLAAATRGHPTDIGTFCAWAAHAAEGLSSFYSTPGYFADYPPGYIYVLWVVGTLRGLLGLGYDSPWFLLLVKSPAILADAGAAWLLYRLARRHWSGAAPAALAALYAFNPAAILDSAAWGQVDGVLTLFVLLGIVLLERFPAASAASFAVAVLVKPQALIFAPLPVLWFVVRFLRRREAGELRPPGRGVIAQTLIFLGEFCLVFCLGVLPFALHNGAGWVIEKYHSTMASYPYATLNAFNFYALVGANGLTTDHVFLFLPCGTWGAVFIALIVAFAALAALRGRDPTTFWYLALFLPAAVFILSAKMHERYLFPALAAALGFFIVARDRWGLWLYAGFTVTQFLNMLEVLALSLQDPAVYLVPPPIPCCWPSRGPTCSCGLRWWPPVAFAASPPEGPPAPAAAPPV